MKYRNLILVTVLILAVGAGDLAAESYASLRSAYQELSRSAQLQRQRSNWERLLRRFDSFISRNPLDRQLEKALFLQARTWDGLSRASGSRSDAREAIVRYAAMSKSYPGSSLADDALFHAGQAAEHRLKDRDQARRYYQRLVDDFPGGDMVGEAQKRLAALPAPAVVEAPVPVVEEREERQAVGDSPRLENVRFWSGPEYTRIVLDLNVPVVSTPHLLRGDNPRLYFDLLYTLPGQRLATTIPVGNGLVKQVRTSLYNEQSSRVVIDLNRVAEYKVTTLNNPHRLVVDIFGSPVGPAIHAPPDDSIVTILDNSAERLPTLHIPQKKKDEGIRLIVVDAGHGGRDPGAIGPNNVREKNVTLQMAKSLAEKLRKNMGVKVLLTRSDDRFIELRERTAYANRVGADLFISLHANASAKGKAYGVETYFLNLSKNNQAAEVAARENGTSLKEVGNLEAILFDLMANAKINESSRLAAEVQQSMVTDLKARYSRIKDLGVKQGPFHVLLGATMPSVLIEAAFISHPREEKRLTSAAYQKHVANAIVKGVKRYSESLEQVAKR